MGYYINPSDGTEKESWLRKNATKVDRETVANFSFTDDNLPVVLVDNGMFTAAGIAYSPMERDALLTPDHRLRQYFIASKEKLTPWYREER